MDTNNMTKKLLRMKIHQLEAERDRLRGENKAMHNAIKRIYHSKNANDIHLISSEILGEFIWDYDSID